VFIPMVSSPFVRYRHYGQYELERYNTTVAGMAMRCLPIGLGWSGRGGSRADKEPGGGVPLSAVGVGSRGDWPKWATRNGKTDH
jgi:hypothetical protein